MKGVSVSDVVGILGVILILFLFFFVILPKTLSFVINNLSSSSAINIASQLSALMSVSPSTYHVEIEFSPGEEEMKYKVEIKERIIKVIPKIKTTYSEKSSSIESILVDFINYLPDETNNFLILKEKIGEESVYKIK
ncbi:MAG: hypothetical protein QXD89_01090 [Candidatus Aenigmatarchaeota archaeon]